MKTKLLVFILLAFSNLYVNAQSSYGKLLKSGTFTFTGVMYGAAGYSSSGMPFLTSFKIYENYLVNEQGNAYPFFGMQTIDGVNCRGYKCNDDCFFIMAQTGCCASRTS